MNGIERPQVLIRRLDPDLPLPAYARAGDAGLDLYARTSVTLPPGKRLVVPTGIALAIPPGWVGLIHPRSGLAARHGLSMVNTPGTIDAGYRGELQVCLLNTDATQPITLQRADRIAQLVLQRVGWATLVEVEDLPSSERGHGGFGSSGGFSESGEVSESGDVSQSGDVRDSGAVSDWPKLDRDSSPPREGHP